MKKTEVKFNVLSKKVANKAIKENVTKIVILKNHKEFKGPAGCMKHNITNIADYYIYEEAGVKIMQVIMTDIDIAHKVEDRVDYISDTIRYLKSLDSNIIVIETLSERVMQENWKINLEKSDLRGKKLQDYLYKGANNVTVFKSEQSKNTLDSLMMSQHLTDYFMSEFVSMHIRTKEFIFVKAASHKVRIKHGDIISYQIPTDYEDHKLLESCKIHMQSDDKDVMMIVAEHDDKIYIVLNPNIKELVIIGESMSMLTTNLCLAFTQIGVDLDIYNISHLDNFENISIYKHHNPGIALGYNPHETKVMDCSELNFEVNLIDTIKDRHLVLDQDISDLLFMKFKEFDENFKDFKVSIKKDDKSLENTRAIKMTPKGLVLNRYVCGDSLTLRLSRISGTKNLDELLSITGRMMERICKSALNRDFHLHVIINDHFAYTLVYGDFLERSKKRI